jgi:antitoxin component YwqK of YwqJK toxin-antitoxin module
LKYYENETLEYEGEMKNGLFCGKGVYYYQDGGKYVGEFENGYFDGEGVYYRKDGTKIYEGTWKDDKYEGYGINYDTAGNI